MEDKVLAAMKEAGKPVRPGDIAKVLGVDGKDVSKAIDVLKKAGKVHSPSVAITNPRPDFSAPPRRSDIRPVCDVFIIRARPKAPRFVFYP